MFSLFGQPRARATLEEVNNYSGQMTSRKMVVFEWWAHGV
jgi:hypothetical protein